MDSLSQLVNDPRVLRHMPLAEGGPWAIRSQGRFAGWGGIQPWDDDVEVALVLMPEFWGSGKTILERFTEQAFGQLQLGHVLATLPRTRKGGRGILGLGFRTGW